jgi:hypothetical protein
MFGPLGVLNLDLMTGNGVGREVALLNQYGSLMHGHGVATKTPSLFLIGELVIWGSDCWYGREISVGYTNQSNGSDTHYIMTKALQVSNHDVAPSEAYTAHRILHGVPEGVIDIPPLHAFPMESNLDVMGASEWFAPRHKTAQTLVCSRF